MSHNDVADAVVRLLVRLGLAATSEPVLGRHRNVARSAADVEMTKTVTGTRVMLSSYSCPFI